MLASVREGCHREGRVWAMMLDLSMGRRATTAIVMNDWKFLCDQVKVREDSRYLHHQGKPVVLLWGLGFKDRPWTPEQGEELVNFFKNDPKYGGVYLIGGIDPFWRTLRGESRTEPAWAKVYRIVRRHQPLGRRPLSRRRRHGPHPQGGLGRRPGRAEGPRQSATCRRRFRASPGTTCAGRRPGRPMIARRKGEFYWRQFAIFKDLGIRTVFVGMFDEVNEATAIYKVADEVPVGKYFVDLRGTALGLVSEADRRRDADDPRRGAAVGDDSRDVAVSEGHDRPGGEIPGRPGRLSSRALPVESRRFLSFSE